MVDGRAVRLAVAAAGVTRPADAIGGCLSPHHHEPLHRGDGGEDEHDPEDRHQDVERQTDAEEHEALGPFHDPAPGREPERLRLRPLVGDEHRQRKHREHQHGEVAALVGQVPGHPAQQDRVRHAIADGVEEAAARPRASTAPSDRAVEDIGQPAQGHTDDPEDEVPVGYEHSRDDREGQPDERETVGADADAMQTAPDGFEPSLDCRSPASVEHVRASSYEKMAEEMVHPEYHRSPRAAWLAGLGRRPW